MNNYPLPAGIIKHLKRVGHDLTVKDEDEDYKDVCDVDIDLTDERIVRFRYYRTWRHVAFGHVRLPTSASPLSPKETESLTSRIRNFYTTIDFRNLRNEWPGIVYFRRKLVCNGRHSRIELNTFLPRERSIVNEGRMMTAGVFYMSRESSEAERLLREDMKRWTEWVKWHREKDMEPSEESDIESMAASSGDSESSYSSSDSEGSTDGESSDDTQSSRDSQDGQDFN